MNTGSVFKSTKNNKITLEMKLGNGTIDTIGNGFQLIFTAFKQRKYRMKFIDIPIDNQIN